MRRFVVRLSCFLRPARAEREMSREIESHLVLLQDDFERRGMAPAEAALAARRVYGGVEQVKERHRDERSFPALEQAVCDLRHAARGLARNPGFALAVVLTLALGIGVNTTLFTAYNAVALKPLPVGHAESVARVERWFQSGRRGNVQYAFSVPEYAYCRDHTTQLSGLVASSWPLQVEASVSSGHMRGQLVSGNYFTDLGVATRLGRGFQPRDQQPGGSQSVIVLSDSAWQRYFLSDPAVVGRAVFVNGASFTIIGVTSADFTGTLEVPQPPDFWALLATQPQLAPGHVWQNEPREPAVQLLARVRSGVPWKRAEAEMDLLVRRFATGDPPDDATRAVTLQRTARLGNTEDPKFQAIVAGIMLIVGLILLVACANVANMTLARGAFRQREISLRMALGAGRGRVVRQLLTESLLMSVLAGVAGLVASVWCSPLLWRTVAQIASPGNTAFALHLDLSPDARVLGYLLAMSLATGVAFGLSPALKLTRSTLNAAIKDEGCAGVPSISRSRLRSWLVGLQVAVSVMLVVTAGFLTRGLLRSRAVEPGFETRHVYSLFGVEADSRLIARLRQVPEVRNAAFGGRPLGGTWTPFIVATGPHGKLAGRTLANGASETYFDTLGIALVHGRTFTPEEVDSHAPVAVISQSAARRFWPGTDPVGQRFTLSLDFKGKLAAFQVIGIVRDVRHANLTRPDPAHVYLPPDDGQANNGVLLRVDGDAQRALAAVRASVEAFEHKAVPGLTMVSLEDGPVHLQRMMSAASATFASILAGLALVLAALGIYGVMAYLVSRRVREIGIRMALGASPRAVLTEVVLAELRPVVLGITIGLSLATAIAWVLSTSLAAPSSADLFYGVPFYDPATLLGLTGFVAAVAVAASAIPARRAIHVDPVVALRHE